MISAILFGLGVVVIGLVKLTALLLRSLIAAVLAIVGFALNVCAKGILGVMEIGAVILFIASAALILTHH